MNLQRLRYFQAVGRFGSFRRAADELNITQPALSRQIKVLEREVGVPLLTRSKRKVALTPGGAYLLQRSTQLLDEAAVVLKDVRQVSTEEPVPFTLGVLQSLLTGVFPQALVMLRKEFGRAPVRVFGFRTHQIVSGVLHGEYDLGIVAGPVDDPKLVGREVFVEPYVAVLPRGHRLARHSTVDLALMASVPLVGSPIGHIIRQMVDAAAGDTLRLKYVAEIESLGAIVELVRAQLGAAVIPLSAVTPLPRGIIARRLVTSDGDDAIVRTIWSIQRAGVTLPRLGRRLPDILAKAAATMPRL
jgi:DNA-binding transcriptional LysR family regulator